MHRLKRNNIVKKGCLSTRFHESGEANPRIATPNLFRTERRKGGQKTEKEDREKLGPPRKEGKRPKKA